MADPNSQDGDAAAIYEELWKSDPNVRYINWDRLYEVNRGNLTTVKDASGRTLATGRKALYMIETATLTSVSSLGRPLLTGFPRAGLRSRVGANFRHNRNGELCEVGDLLGADFVYDIDKFAERDFGGDATKSQVDLLHPDRIVQKGDRFSYDYTAQSYRYQMWANATYHLTRLDAYTGISYTHTGMQREGHQKRGLFPDNSYGLSDRVKFNDLGVKAGATYELNGHHYLQTNVAYLEQAPTFQNLFISPRTRDSYIEDPKSEKDLLRRSLLPRTPSLAARTCDGLLYPHRRPHALDELLR